MTEGIENALGTVVAVEKTAEYYENLERVAESVPLREGNADSDVTPIW